MGRSRPVPIGRFAASLLLLLTLCLCLARVARGQYQPPSDYLLISASRASAWTEESTNILALQGPLTIQTDRAKMTADRAVIWLTPLPGSVLDQQRAEIALMGNVTLEQQQPQITRSGESLFVTTEVRGTIRLTGRRVAENLSESDLYRDASTMRPLKNIVPPGGSGEWIVQRPWVTTPPPAPPSTAPTTQELVPKQHVSIQFSKLEPVHTGEDKSAFLVTGGLTIVQTRPNGDVIQLQAERGVLFTDLQTVQEVTRRDVEETLTAAYMEGDVRIVDSPIDKEKAEQRLRAERVYYEFATQRAVLTDAVVHTVEPQAQIPVVLRAKLIRQLSEGEIKAEGVTLSTSSFATPSYAIHSDRAYVRTYDTGEPRLGQRTDFKAKNNVFSLQGVPVFYWPYAAGSITERGMPLRALQLGSSRGFGPGVRSEWGLFESLGQIPPEDLDASFHLDYFNDRGPATGLDASYKGGFITETSKQPWTFEGDFTSYIVNDNGSDRLGRDRAHVQPDDELRYRFEWQHQHFFPEDWQLQLRAGISSDPTFLEEWFQRDFNTGLPEDFSAYLKRQRQTEALTLAINYQANDFVTTADQLQENFEVERLPEIGYYRTGDSLMDDNLTFFSANTVSAMHFNVSGASYEDLGFRKQYDPFPLGLPAGFPSQGYTGVTDDIVLRGDFRQEIDYPFSAGQFRVVPYVVARPTLYSDSPDEGSQTRLTFAAGTRISTAFWRVDDTAQSDLFDIHRIRHVVEPEVNLFTSTSTVDRNDVFIYDEPVDAINDISAIQLALRQRWQTKRGGAGQWRSVDFFSLNVEGNFFANKPDEVDDQLSHFRGLFFPSLPEASVPRNSINADALWRASDTTDILADAQYNLDENELATTSIGMAVQRDTRLSYFVGVRYIDIVDSVIASFATNYNLTAKYSLQLVESVSLNDRRSENTSVTLTRRFDRYFMTFTFYYDQIDDEGGFRFGIFPEGLGYGLTSDQLQNSFGRQ
jgi:lipopolysaccharide assembly outer membrane protein LptD (OstA)